MRPRATPDWLDSTTVLKPARFKRATAGPTPGRSPSCLGRGGGGKESVPGGYLDRDGTLNFDPGYLTQPEQLRLLPGVGPAVARLNRAGFKTVVLSNQSGVARGLITQDQLEAIHQRLRELLAEDGAWLDGIFICPHHPDEGCICRKPAPGLVHRALQELGVFPGNAIVIGDKATDVELARNVGALAVFVRSGNAPEEEQARMAERSLAPDYVARNLTEAVRWILRTVNTQETLIVKR